VFDREHLAVVLARIRVQMSREVESRREITDYGDDGDDDDDDDVVNNEHLKGVELFAQSVLCTRGVQ